MDHKNVFNLIYQSIFNQAPIKNVHHRKQKSYHRLREKGDLEVDYFNIQAKLKSKSQRMFVPKEGKLIHDIERAWQNLEKAEHDRELAMRNEMIRQERLEHLAQKFEKKVGVL